jgi:hypothetical protein
VANEWDPVRRWKGYESKVLREKDKLLGAVELRGDVESCMNWRDAVRREELNDVEVWHRIDRPQHSLIGNFWKVSMQVNTQASDGLSKIQARCNTPPPW